MQDALLTYFNGEKNAGLLLIVIGGAGLVAAATFFQARWGLRSFAVTLGVVALLEITLGAGLYLRTGPQVRTLVTQLGSEPARFYSDEATRMQRVQRNFVLIEYVELAVIVACAILAIAQKRRPGVAGVALGLLVHAAILLAFDLVAERRGAAYLSAIAAAPSRRT